MPRAYILPRFRPEGAAAYSPGSCVLAVTLGIKDQGQEGFAWQGGYGAFSVSQSRVEEVTCYIKNQREHHRTRSFQEEYWSFLRRHHVEFDERYVWD